MGSVSPAQVSDGTTIDASDVNNPINTIANEFNGNIDNTNIKAAAAITGSKLADNSIDITTKASSWDGWIQVTDTFTYASATTITVPSDATTKYSVGDKLKMTNSGTKYFYIVGVAATVLTVTGGTDYTVANAAISGVYYSKAATPLSFPYTFAFTPSWTNITVGNGTNVGAFSMDGKRVTVRTKFTLGSTSSVGTNPSYAYPITKNTYYTSNLEPLGAATGKLGGNYWKLSTVARTGISPVALVTSGSYTSYNDVTATVPGTWANADILWTEVSYDAA